MLCFLQKVDFDTTRIENYFKEAYPMYCSGVAVHQTHDADPPQATPPSWSVEDAQYRES